MVWLISLLLACCSSQALTAKTSNIIHGNAPYLTFDGGLTSVTSSEGFLWITLSNGIKFTPANNNSSINPIELPNSGQSFADIGMLVPTDSNSIALNSLISAPNHYWGDDDGDGLGNNGISLTGNLNLTITDKDNQPVSRNEVLDICKAPYRVMLSTTEGKLSTQYGFPNSSVISATNQTYYINPKGQQPLICFIKLNLHFGSGKEIDWGGIFDSAGPPDIWNTKKGFIPQSSYEQNFPTTGANNLYFDLDIGGAGPLIWEEKIEHGGITAEITPDANGSLVRITLKGPAATPEQHKSVSPDNIAKPILPQMFELIGKDRNGNAVIKYGFNLKRWFVNRGEEYTKDPSVAKDWCGKIGYLMPQVKDLTNSTCKGSYGTVQCKNIEGAQPLSSGNYFKRIIGAGFFSEWGFTKYYTAANFSTYDYWLIEASGKAFWVNSENGYVSDNLPHSGYGVICVWR